MVDAADLSPNLHGVFTIGYLGRCSVLKWSNSTTLDVCTLINKDGTRKVYHFADVSKMYIPLEIRAVQRKIGIYKNN